MPSETPSLIDTIAAISTPPGVGAIAVVRVSGPDAFAIVSALSEGQLDLSTDADRRAQLVRLSDPESGAPLDQVLATLFHAPDSYTGEDLVEISTHGGRVAPQLVLSALINQGARLARPGEFTQRAYLNGKVDLLQAEAVGDLVESGSRALHRVALHHLDRGLSGRLSELRESLVGLEATLAHHVDFPDEDDAPIPVAEIARRADLLASDFLQLAATAPLGELLREGALAVLAGRPNAGKSSLLNALVGEERAIVTDQPGTTRDRIEVAIEVEGLPFRLVDTAGLRDSSDEVERIGVEVAHRALASADIVLFCIPADEDPSEEDRAFLSTHSGCPLLLLRTCVDRLGPEQAATEGLAVSAESGEGLAELRAALCELVFEGHVVEGEASPVLTRERQVRGVRSAAGEIEAFGDALRSGVPPEVAAAHLKSAATATEELLGTVGIEDILDRLFSDFCVGK